MGAMSVKGLNTTPIEEATSLTSRANWRRQVVTGEVCHPAESMEREESAAVQHSDWVDGSGRSGHRPGDWD